MAALSPMPVGKQVFLLVIGPITAVMHGMTPAAATVKKAAFGRSKSPADAGKKIADCGSPSPALPRALKNHRYFHFIGVVRRHYRAFTRRSGYDVW